MLYKERLKNLREEKEIKQYELSKLLNFHELTYGKFEREETIFPIKQLEKICNYFNVSLDYIFKFTNTKYYINLNKEIDNKLSGQRLKEFRKDNNLTQSKLADYLNTTQSNIVGYEQGKFIIATPYLYMICKKYHISADYLLGRTDNPKYLK